MKKAVNVDIWKKFTTLGEKQGSIKVSDLAQEMELSQEDALGFINKVFPPGSGVVVSYRNNELWVDFKSESIQYMLPLTPAEWIQLHQIISSAKVIESPVSLSLKKKVTDNGPIKVVMELLNQLELWNQELTDLQQNMIKELEAAVEEKHLVTLRTQDQKVYQIHPCKVLHLEGQLSLIGEDTGDHCLLVVPLKQIESFETFQKPSLPKVTTFEVEEFIAAIRAMNEKETRLILKIYDPQSINLFPDHHFLGKPCMVTNPNGDLIWAAYVEPCDSLYEWLMTLGHNVEILDPIGFKEEYLMYCEEKLRKIA